MRIGIDARPLATKQLTGIGMYLKRIIQYINEKCDGNEYFLYTHREIENIGELSDNFHVIVDVAKIGTIWMMVHLNSLLERDKIDVFWGTQQVLPPKKAEIKYVVTIHDLALFINPKWGKWNNLLFQRIFVPISVRNADRILAVSETTKLDLIRILNCAEEKVFVTYQALDKKDTEVKNEKNINGISDNYYFFCSTFEPRKNIITLVKAFERCIECGVDADLLLAGGRGWNCSDIYSYIGSSKCKDRIKILGYVSNDEKKLLYKNAIAYVFPSLYEGFGLTVLEAMTEGGIVITSAVSALPEVGGGSVMYISNPLDNGMLADKMIEAANLSLNMREQMRKICKLQVDKFDYETVNSNTLRLIVNV